MEDIDKLMSDFPQFNYQYERMPEGIDGLNIGNEIIINSQISEEEQLQWLYEEIGHALTSEGNITNYGDRNNMRQEHEARMWGMKHHISFDSLADIPADEYENDYEAARDLGVQVDYLHTVGFMYGFRYKSID